MWLAGPHIGAWRASRTAAASLGISETRGRRAAAYRYLSSPQPNAQHWFQFFPRPSPPHTEGDLGEAEQI